MYNLIICIIYLNNTHTHIYIYYTYRIRTDKAIHSIHHSHYGYPDIIPKPGEHLGLAMMRIRVRLNHSG